MLQLHPHLAPAKTADDREMIQRQTPHPAVADVDATDQQIDALVASRVLYSLTAEEIKIVEGEG